MAETSQPAAVSANTSAGHLSVRVEGLHPVDLPFLFEQQPKRMGLSLAASMAFQAGIALLLIVLSRYAPEAARSFLPEQPNSGIVWLAEPGNEADRQRLIDAAHTLQQEIPEVRRLSVGVALPHESPLVDSSFDLCFVMEFDDRAAMDRYAEHPAHTKAAQEAFLPLARKLLFYDFVGE